MQSYCSYCGALEFVCNCEIELSISDAKYIKDVIESIDPERLKALEPIPKRRKNMNKAERMNQYGNKRR